ncbi:hypothetical protein CBR_g54648 [Chara braunii]|uniref:Uncharacterized protein n=1 Tax=Chara braunii TaxID=69332 RepID=A0A388MCG9_CHABU|nr:hypothetical protein CBR_g54648 [Chara braunii]|eukprot:GBG92203.1 hypothetical protein CBR_g54648 [Chara braunii]
MSENFVVKETLYDSVAQELRDNDTEEEEPTDDDDEEGESSDDDDEEEETSEDTDSEDTDSEDDEGQNDSGIDVDMFKKSLFGKFLGEAKQIIAQEVRRGLYNKSSKSEKPPYNLGKRGRNARLDIFKSEPTGQVQASPKYAIRSLEARYRLTCRGEDKRRDKVVSSEGHVHNRKAGGSSKFKVDDDALSIAALKTNVHALSHYAQPHNIEWWNKLIATQETLDLEDTNLKEPFAWPSVTADISRAGEEVPPTANGFNQRWDDLFSPERPIYIGARKSRQFREDRDGKYNDLEVNTFIALRACSGQEERDKPCHIGKVVELLAGL